MEGGKFTTLQKIAKQKRAATQIETDVANAFLALETPETRDLKFLSAREFEVSQGKKAVIIVVPYVQRKAFHDQTVRKAKRNMCSEAEVLITSFGLIFASFLHIRNSFLNSKRSWEENTLL